MNKASRWRYALAQKMVPFYNENTKVRLVEIGGSVARGWADHIVSMRGDATYSLRSSNG